MIDLFAPDQLAMLPPAAIFAALFFGTFISEDAACVAGGALAASGQFPLAAAVGACFGGILAGDVGIFLLGRTVGRRAAETRLGRRFLHEERLAEASAWLVRRGARAVFLSRFVFGLRVPTYFAAGLLRTSFLRFFLYLALAALVWTPILVGASAFSLRGFSFSGWTLAFAAVGVVAALRLAFALSTWKRRRLLVGRIGRILEWEFWPLWAFYAPVVAYVAYLGARFRRPTLFTAANPSIPHAGFAGESKAEIYRGLARSPGAAGRMLGFFVAGPELDADELRRLRLEGGLGFPLIVKPDSGERGKGVVRVGSDGELSAAVAGASGPSIVQEFFDGVEASVFYVRHPEDDRGNIFSITEKVFPSVAGDGRSTLEELILRDRRAVRLAEKYFEQNAGRLESVPAAGEIVSLIGIGTHSRGAIFLDGAERLADERLERAIDDICRGYEGFYFGRFDLRAPDFDALRTGRDFRIIELNGVTSESTNIYDPKFSLRAAYRVLFRQWRLAFEIGAANEARGAAVATPPLELLQVAARHVFGGA